MRGNAPPALVASRNELGHDATHDGSRDCGEARANDRADQRFGADRCGFDGGGGWIWTAEPVADEGGHPDAQPRIRELANRRQNPAYARLPSPKLAELPGETVARQRDSRRWIGGIGHSSPMEEACGQISDAEADARSSERVVLDQGSKRFDPRPEVLRYLVLDLGEAVSGLLDSLADAVVTVVPGLVRGRHDVLVQVVGGV